MWEEERISEEYVYGVMFDDRQKAVARCRAGDPIEFIREPDNAVDSLAVKILVRGRHVGYFKEELSERYAKSMDRGVIRFEAVVAAIEPFTRDRKKWLGIRIELHRFRLHEPPEVVAARDAEQKAKRAKQRKDAKQNGLTLGQYDALPLLKPEGD